MSDAPPEGQQNQSPAKKQENLHPATQMRILSQYVRDLSFENPDAPHNLTDFSNKDPKIDVQINVNGRRLAETDYTIDLKIEVTAKSGDSSKGTNTFFMVELVYGGLFRLINVPEDALQQVIMVECPRHLFPYARRVLADAVRDGGFPPVMLDPVDFGQLYASRVKHDTVNTPEPSHINGSGTV
ncbi:MAG: protein-export chaperone SecB [Parvularculales bacterium]